MTTIINNFSNTHLGEQVWASDLVRGDVLGNGEVVVDVHTRDNPLRAGASTVWVDTDAGASRITGRNRKVWIVKRTTEVML